MAEIQAFRAWRYQAEVVGEINQQFSPLYDVVNEQQLADLYSRDFNSIHLSMPRSAADAPQVWADWQARGIIAQDERPSIYIFYQYFSLFGHDESFVRKGFIAGISLDEAEIILHEGVMQRSVNERMQLLAKSRFNVAPTHGLYSDPAFEMEEIMDTAIKNYSYKYIDYQGVVNKMAVIDQPEKIALFQDFFQKKKIYLADGHHRLAASFALKDQLISQGKKHPEETASSQLMYLSNMEGDDLRILPTHRIWHPKVSPNIAAVRERLERWFWLEDVSRSRAPLFNLLKDKRYAFGVVGQGRRWIMHLKEKFDPTKILELDLPKEVLELDYTLLHALVFDKVLGIPYAEQGLSDEISYEKDYVRALSQVNKGQAALSFITQSVDIKTFIDICKTGAKMPPKSTYFYPKVVCGMVFMEV